MRRYLRVTQRIERLPRVATTVTGSSVGHCYLARETPTTRVTTDDASSLRFSLARRWRRILPPRTSSGSGRLPLAAGDARHPRTCAIGSPLRSVHKPGAASRSPPRDLNERGPDGTASRPLRRTETGMQKDRRRRIGSSPVGRGGARRFQRSEGHAASSTSAVVAAVTDVFAVNPCAARTKAIGAMTTRARPRRHRCGSHRHQTGARRGDDARLCRSRHQARVAAPWRQR